MEQLPTLICTLPAREGPGMARAVSAWQIRFHTKVIRFEGFLSADLLPPQHAGSRDWKLIARFATHADLDRWMHSAERGWLVAEAEELLADEACFSESVPDKDENAHPGGVTEIIRSEVRPGMEEAYRLWTRRTQETQARFPGFRGVHVIAPTPGSGSSEWTTLLRFDTEENLDHWRYSPERSALLEEAREVIQKTGATRLKSPFPGWVPLDVHTGTAPPRWKAGLLVLVGLYPLVMLNLLYLRPLLASLPMAVLTLVLNLLTVAATTYLTMPLLVRHFAWWLSPAPPRNTFQDDRNQRRTSRRGLQIIIAIISVELLSFWLLAALH